jgi:hypothetical protein
MILPRRPYSLSATVGLSTDSNPPHEAANHDNDRRDKKCPPQCHIQEAQRAVHFFIMAVPYCLRIHIVELYISYDENEDQNQICKGDRDGHNGSRASVAALNWLILMVVQLADTVSWIGHARHRN